MGRMLITVLLLASSAMAQTTPVLEKRGERDGAAQQMQAMKGFSTLPENTSGEYELDEPRSENSGSVVQITIEHGRLTGYVTKMERETALTLFFGKSAIHGSRVSFTTATVHGLRYSFEGEIVRGHAERASLTGFYRMVGEWTAYRNGVQETESVSLKSTPRD